MTWKHDIEDIREHIEIINHELGKVKTDVAVLKDRWKITTGIILVVVPILTALIVKVL